MLLGLWRHFVLRSSTWRHETAYHFPSQSNVASYAAVSLFRIWCVPSELDFKCTAEGTGSSPRIEHFEDSIVSRWLQLRLRLVRLLERCPQDFWQPTSVEPKGTQSYEVAFSRLWSSMNANVRYVSHPSNLSSRRLAFFVIATNRGGCGWGAETWAGRRRNDEAPGNIDRTTEPLGTSGSLSFRPKFYGAVHEDVDCTDGTSTNKREADTLSSKMILRFG